MKNAADKLGTLAIDVAVARDHLEAKMYRLLKEQQAHKRGSQTYWGLESEIRRTKKSAACALRSLIALQAAQELLLGEISEATAVSRAITA